MFCFKGFTWCSTNVLIIILDIVVKLILYGRRMNNRLNDFPKFTQIVKYDFGYTTKGSFDVNNYALLPH